MAMTNVEVIESLSELAASCLASQAAYEGLRRTASTSDLRTLAEQQARHRAELASELIRAARQRGASLAMISRPGRIDHYAISPMPDGNGNGSDSRISRGLSTLEMSAAQIESCLERDRDCLTAFRQRWPRRLPFLVEQMIERQSYEIETAIDDVRQKLHR